MLGIADFPPASLIPRSKGQSEIHFKFLMNSLQLLVFNILTFSSLSALQRISIDVSG